jgi:hypothetical protein
LAKFIVLYFPKKCSIFCYLGFARLRLLRFFYQSAFCNQLRRARFDKFRARRVSLDRPLLAIDNGVKFQVANDAKKRGRSKTQTYKTRGFIEPVCMIEIQFVSQENNSFFNQKKKIFCQIAFRRPRKTSQVSLGRARAFTK